MRTLLLAATLLLPLAAQNEGSKIIEGPSTYEIPTSSTLTSRLHVKVRLNPDQSKTLELSAEECRKYGPRTECSSLPATAYVNWAFVKVTVRRFERDYADEVTHVKYFARSVPPPPTPPQLIVLEAKSDARLFLFDLSKFTSSQAITLPNGARTFGVRPMLSGPDEEVWTAHAGIGNQITVGNLNTVKIVAAIPTKLDENATPVGIVFSNSGLTAYYVVNYLNPDANGNRGAMLTIDTETRKVTTTLPMPNRPQSVLMAPDGLTAYIVGDGKIAYYDLLSGTADLIANFPTVSSSPGQYIHPDGNRIFTLQSFPVYAVSVFDVAQRKVINQFPIKFAGLPIKLELSQDGTTLTLLSNKDEVQNLNVVTGSVISSFLSSPGTFDLFTSPVLQ